MLDTTTKRRIDTARDILVGKVPDPKSQVEQITIALIYKFMDDMDAGAEELGGARTFFTGPYARYGWARLMDPSIGGHEMLSLYGEGIAKMPENPGIPPLFRDIFKNAYLPYRDPETLKAFLKIIDEFSYDHSERLGDAFEYLLSCLSSQGDAGMFRTPRHIIDFMVEVLAPQKDEVILDPACGTAGFLISAYKHILRSNSSKPSPQPPTAGRGRSEAEAESRATGDLLTPDDRGRLAKNFRGYDISPDMVRLSLVNLYLHGFTDPHIYEYDTLTSEERWNEFADVILANPPFMSPKGGIKPHKRFSIQAKRSEVLFVDYMAEHLTPNGRAGIIVPEGIIFQSQGAYSELRKLLVETSLVAVISLPAGVFQPYSGVKTSILLLDKSLAKQATTIAFFKVENDGFGLGAQRRAIEKNDLPRVQAELAEYLVALRSGKPFEASADFRAKGPAPYQPGETPQETRAKNGKGLKARPISHADDGSGLQPSENAGDRGPGTSPQAGMDGTVGAQYTTAQIVPKEKIAANGDYNLSGERYREGSAAATTFPRIRLAEICAAILTGPFGTSLHESDYVENGIPVINPKNIIEGVVVKDGAKMVSPATIDRLKEFTLRENDIVIARRGEMGRCAVVTAEMNGWLCGTGCFVIRLKPICELGFAHLQLSSPKVKARLEEQAVGVTLLNLNQGILADLEIPLPPLEVQKEIVAEIEGYQKVINGARAVLDHYRPHIPIHPDWPMVELNQVCEVKSGGTPSRSEDSYWNGTIPWVGSTVCKDCEVMNAEEFITEAGLNNSAAKLFPKDTTLIALVGATIGKTGLLKFESTTNQNIAGLYPKSQDLLEPIYLFHAVQQLYPEFMKLGEGKFRMANLSFVREQKIPLPPLSTQQSIVAEIEAEQSLVAANRELITRFEQKIQSTLARIWGEDELGTVTAQN